MRPAPTPADAAAPGPPGPVRVVVLAGAADPRPLRGRLPGVTVHVTDSLDAVPPQAASAAQILVVRSGVLLDAPRLASWPALRHVIRAGSGTDGLDLDTLAAHGVTVHRNPHPAADAVAEWALAALLSLGRRIPVAQAELLAGRHTKGDCLTRPVRTMNLAVWGAGPVGRACGRVLAAHVAEVAYAARPSLPPGLASREPDDLMAWADIHVVALPATAETRAVVGPAFLSAARSRSPLLICVGRLATLDVPACVRALLRGDLAGLALDPVDPGDLPLPVPDGVPLNLVVSPHVGAQRTDVRAALDTWVARTAAVCLSTGAPA